MPSILISQDGELKSSYKPIDSSQLRSQAYRKVSIDDPLVVEYRRIALKTPGSSTRKLMISTYFKVTEEKEGAAEAISYYSPEALFVNDRFTLTDFGGKEYGHPLCYYTKAYAGEALRFTIWPAELNELGKDVVKAITATTKAIGGVPMFAEFIPYLTLANAGASVFQAIANVFLHDESFSMINADFHFKGDNARILQSGRFVLVPDPPKQTITDDDLIGKYVLTPSNELQSKTGGNEFDGSYFVMSIDSRENTSYQRFDYYQNAASLLALTNRGGSLSDLEHSIAPAVSGSADMDLVKRIEKLVPNAAASKDKANALFRQLSADMQKIYQSRFDTVFSGIHPKVVILN